MLKLIYQVLFSVQKLKSNAEKSSQSHHQEYFKGKIL